MTEATQYADEIQQDVDDTWQKLWEFAQGCIQWGESDIDKDEFINEGKERFRVFLIK